MVNGTPETEANAAFIAACSPSTILALVAENDYYKSAMNGERPGHVPKRVKLAQAVTGDGPYRSTRAEADGLRATSAAFR